LAPVWLLDDDAATCAALEPLLRAMAIAVLGTSEKTVKVHRGRVMHKLRASSVVDLVRLSDQAARSRPERRADPRRAVAPGDVARAWSQSPLQA